ncbi:unannotated protein [freshwater metagenome]|uniref:Unannotated protein n=1 Tax=freshwater metagenome TaxID=449393 RepID=A0A6J7VPC1_9ZZZZ|nr:DUF4956 domain-containing protein [Actinomycetota bacterium]MSY08246.1 DUF4956 domain-containing protein [Actinomycetota bacterium]MSZ37419.1 DUF4956 domain-containing protein [Actinomycetota bacterium]MTA09397.1 DUF4956 domain-containing protein [Actinomycetota bacterium]MTA68510.1 DUF4956 domain-containing protein [Actinomycetota bacterium]
MDGLDSVELIRDLTLNLVSIFVLVFMIYFRRHRRWDQVVGYVAFNISLFTVSAALGASGPINVGVGFGLFAVLSVVRLRSEESGQIEIGFTMVALVLGLMAGMPGMGFQIKIIFASLLVVTMFFIDIVSLGGKSRYQRIKIELDVVINDESDLISHLEKTFSRRVQSVNIRSIDVVRDIMVIDVLFRSPK